MHRCTACMRWLCKRGGGGVSLRQPSAEDRGRSQAERRQGRGRPGVPLGLDSDVSVQKNPISVEYPVTSRPCDMTNEGSINDRTLLHGGIGRLDHAGLGARAAPAHGHAWGAWHWHGGLVRRFAGSRAWRGVAGVGATARHGCTACSPCFGRGAAAAAFELSQIYITAATAISATSDQCDTVAAPLRRSQPC